MHLIEYSTGQSLEMERKNKAHFGLAVATRTEISKPVSLKSATLAACSVGFLLAKVVCFCWLTNVFFFFFFLIF